MSALFIRRSLLSVMSLFSALALITGCTEKVEAEGAGVKQAVASGWDVSTPASAETVAAVTAKFAKIRSGLNVLAVEKAEAEGIYQVFFDGQGSVYMVGDSSYFFTGDLLQLEGSRVVNVKEEKSNGPRAELMASVSRDDMIVFSPKGEMKASVAVFTDVDCGYCRKLHKEVPKMNELGIEVKYLAYPRAGLNSQSFNKIASAWCASDRNAALTKLKSGEDLAINVCEVNPVAAQYNLGIRAGLSGTPAIVLDSGQLIPGYMDAEQLAKTLGI